jgi:hypothetical protein
MVIFGGYDFFGNGTSDFWALNVNFSDLHASRWENLSPRVQGSIPVGRIGAAHFSRVTPEGFEIWIIGGADKDARFNVPPSADIYRVIIPKDLPAPQTPTGDFAFYRYLLGPRDPTSHFFCLLTTLLAYQWHKCVVDGRNDSWLAVSLDRLRQRTGSDADEPRLDAQHVDIHLHKRPRLRFVAHLCGQRWRCTDNECAVGIEFGVIQRTVYL